MKKSLILKKLLTGACVYFTVCTVLLLIINLLLKDSAEIAIGVLNILLLFPFALSLSAGSLIRESKLSGVLRAVLHYFVFTAAFMLFLWLPSRMTKSLTNVLIMLVLITVGYWLVFLVSRFTVHRFHSFKEE